MERDCKFKATKPNNAFITFENLYIRSNSDKWIIDILATEQVPGNKDCLIGYKELVKPRSIIIDDGKVIKWVGVGTVKLQVWDGKMWRDTSLSNVMYMSWK